MGSLYNKGDGGNPFARAGQQPAFSRPNQTGGWGGFFNRQFNPGQGGNWGQLASALAGGPNWGARGAGGMQNGGWAKPNGTPPQAPPVQPQQNGTPPQEMSHTMAPPVQQQPSALASQPQPEMSMTQGQYGAPMGQPTQPAPLGMDDAALQKRQQMAQAQPQAQPGGALSQRGWY